MASQCRQNFHEECEAAINRQINLELHASYIYMAMGGYFDRDDVALPGFYTFFLKSSDEERDHALILQKYQRQRGGRVVHQDIKKPERDTWGSALEAMQAALALEKTVNQSLLDLHAIATKHTDPQLCDFLEDKFLKEQVEAIKVLSDHISELKRCGDGLGEYLYDKNNMQA